MWMETYEDYLSYVLHGETGTQEELLLFFIIGIFFIDSKVTCPFKLELALLLLISN